MKNLQNFGVQELNAKEIKETEGGIIPLLILAADVFIWSTVSSYVYHKYIKD